MHYTYAIFGGLRFSQEVWLPKKQCAVFMEKESGSAYVRNGSGGKINPLQKIKGSRFYCSENLGNKFHRNARTESKFNGQELCCGKISVKSTLNGSHTALRAIHTFLSMWKR